MSHFNAMVWVSTKQVEYEFDSICQRLKSIGSKCDFSNSIPFAGWDAKNNSYIIKIKWPIEMAGSKADLVLSQEGWRIFPIPTSPFSEEYRKIDFMLRNLGCREV